MKFDACRTTDPHRSEEKIDACTCAHCRRTFKSAAYLVSSGERALCVTCYERLIDPFPRLCCDGAAF
ncbi:MAG: hypothetical protein MUF46_04670 [Desulfobacterales bacterium]|jgi:ribosomal protein L37AE/L43A|nr:hypothetical protein [Desulfobacterales bacterium]